MPSSPDTLEKLTYGKEFPRYLARFHTLCVYRRFLLDGPNAFNTHAVASLRSSDGSAIAMGGTGFRSVFSPPLVEGIRPPSSTIYMAMSMYNEGKPPPFKNLHQFQQQCKRNRDDGSEYIDLTEFRHFVPICPAARQARSQRR